jgi:hypothetical protein
MKSRLSFSIVDCRKILAQQHSSDAARKACLHKPGACSGVSSFWDSVRLYALWCASAAWRVLLGALLVRSRSSPRYGPETSETTGSVCSADAECLPASRGSRPQEPYPPVKSSAQKVKLQSELDEPGVGGVVLKISWQR